MSAMRKGCVSMGLAALALLAACQPAARESATDPAADQAAVREVADELYRHLEAGDYAAAAQFYSEDALIIAPGATPVDKQTLFSTLARSPPPLPENGATKWAIDVKEVVVSGDLAYERGSYTATIVDKSTGDALPGVPQGPEILFVHIFKREPDGRWRAWRYHPAPNVAAAPPEAQ
jgi:ketosteroid isomerase-like protein